MLQLSLLAYLLLVPVSPFGGNHGVPAPPPPPPPPNFPPPATAPKIGGNTGAPSSGSGGGATAPAKPNAGPATGTRPITPVGPNTGRPYRAPAGATATAMNTSTIDLTTWEYWWLYNKDSYLDIKSHIAASVPNTGLDAEAEAARAWDLAGERIFTELLTVLKDEQAHEPALAAMVALARMCDGSVRSRATEVANACQLRRTDPNQSVADGSVIALGVLAHESTVGPLCDLLRDTPAARKTMGGRAVPERARAFAGMALGLVGSRTKNEDLRRFVVHHLVQQLNDEQGAQPDTQVACVLALGLTRLTDTVSDAPGATAAVLPPSASLMGEVGLLLALLDDPKTPIYVRAHLPKALARLAVASRTQERVTRTLLAHAADRNEKTEVVDGCVLALGELPRSGSATLDKDVRDALVQQMATGEGQARCFATIALAQLAGSEEEGPRAEATRTLFLESLATGRSTRERCWSALALGVMQHARGKGSVLPKSVETGLSRALREAKSPEEVGALSIACGLAGVNAATPVLLDHLKDVKEIRASGYVALSLGMLGASDALEPLRVMLEEGRTCSEKLPQTAMALTVMEDPLLVGKLLGLLDKGTSQSTRQAAAIALGAVGDRRVVDSLVALLHDESSNASTRGAVIVALGRVCDRDRLPWQLGLSEGLNYRAMTVTLSDENHAGLLDVR